MINYLDESPENRISKFGDDTKMVSSKYIVIRGSGKTGREPTCLDEWNEKWLIRFRSEKSERIFISVIITIGL